MRRCLMVMVLMSLLAAACRSGGADGPEGQAGGAVPSSERPLQRVTVGVPGPSLSYLPAYLALKLGYFRQEGLDVEFVRMGGTTAVPAILSGELDYTTLLSAVGANAGQGGPMRMAQFHSVRLQHVLSVRPEITAIAQLAGRRVAVQSLGTLTAFETRKIADHFGLADVATLAVGGDLERIRRSDFRNRAFYRAASCRQLPGAGCLQG